MENPNQEKPRTTMTEEIHCVMEKYNDWS